MYEDDDIADDMMDALDRFGACPVCASSRRGEIEERLSAGESPEQIGRKTDIGPGWIYRHRDRHIMLAKIVEAKAGGA